jgi:hypothetical protein
MLLKVCSNFCTWEKVVRTPDLSLSAAYFGRTCIFHLLKNVTLFFDSGLIEGEILSNPPKKTVTFRNVAKFSSPDFDGILHPYGTFFKQQMTQNL